MSNNASEPESLLSVVCDDVRSEERGKVSLIGVYPSRSVGFGSFPASRKTFYVLDVVQGLEPGAATLRHRLSVPPGATVEIDGEEREEPTRESDFEITEQTNNVLFAVDLGPIRFIRPGTYRSDLEFLRDGEVFWSRALEFHVLENPDLPG